MNDDADLNRAAWEIARRHYVDDESMTAIAASLGVSHSTVSRRLRRARDAGLVEIRVASSPDGPESVQRRLWERWNVRAVVVPSVSSPDEGAALDAVSATAARLILETLPSPALLGVAWGATMEAVSRKLPTQLVADTTVVQLNGAGNFHTTGVPYASELLRRFGDAIGARVEQFPAPAFFDDPATRDAMWRERSTRRILDLHSRLDVAVFGIGSPFAEARSHVYQGGYLNRVDVDQLKAERVVGDVATVFYRADGSSNDIPLNRRASGPSFAILRRARRRICVVHGLGKEAALRGALSAQLITDLVVDQRLGERLLRRTA